MLCVALLLISVVVGAQLFMQRNVPGPPEKVLVSGGARAVLPAAARQARGRERRARAGLPRGGGAPRRRSADVHGGGGPASAGRRLPVTFANARGSAMTSCVAWYASAVELEMALEQLPNVDSVDVARAP
ncbi:Immunoglobulin-like fold [Phytophthora cinnamomi]|uniref:Immunoglobulin-like fold n=1 Tax=Phytophthora cinnamomi TaxID=4785 RepID=UPI0035593A39|nr:Immunoglobulin-like fold [Phytophthora cinnamomi]